MQKRLLDVTISAVSLLLLAVPMLIIGIFVKLTSPGPALYWSRRVGRRNLEFQMPKFRSMRSGTPVTATHQLDNPDGYVTPFGRFLRKSSLDELPQLWCVLRGDMSLVGPRPALFNQADLIELRTKAGVHTLTPGLTGWAQVNGRDNVTLAEKVEFDRYYLLNSSLMLDVRIMGMTVKKVFTRENVTH